MTDSSFTTIILEQRDTLAVLKLNRPESLNSINTQMHKELKEALKIIKAKKHRALLISGTGKAFCSGQDLKERRDNLRALGDSLERHYNPLIQTLVHFPCPIVCAVNGVAAGAGVSLALACDLVIASEKATFIQAFGKIGLVPDSGATWILPRLVGHARAAGLMMLAETITAQQAEKWGMIWQVVSADMLEEKSLKLTQRLASIPAQSSRHLKTALLHSWYNNLREQLDLERDLQTVLGTTQEYREGISAFLASSTTKQGHNEAADK